MNWPGGAMASSTGEIIDRLARENPQAFGVGQALPPGQPSPTDGLTLTGPQTLGEPQKLGEPDFSSIIQSAREDEKSALKQSLFVARETAPDRQAEISRLAREIKLPVAFVAQNYDELARHAKNVSLDYDDIIDRIPKTAEFLKTPEHASLAQDHVKKLGEIEENLKEYGLLESAYRNLHANIAGMAQGIYESPALVYEIGAIPQNIYHQVRGEESLKAKAPEILTGIPQAKYFKERAKEYTTPDMSIEVPGEIWRSLKSAASGDSAQAQAAIERAGRGIFVQVVANSPQLVAMIGATVATGGAALPVLVGMGVLSASQKASQLREEGVDPLTVATNALTTGAIESIAETFGTFGILKKWQTDIAKQMGEPISRQVIKEFAKSVAYSGAAEGNEEAVTSFAQDLTDYITGTNPDALKGIVGRALHSGIIGGVSGLGLGGAGAATGLTLSRQHAVRQAHMAKDFYTNLGRQIEGLPLTERSLEATKSFVDVLTRGSDIENISISTEALETFFQSKKLDPAVELNRLGLSDKYNEAKQTGIDMEVPLSEWVHKTAGSDVYQGVANDIKFRIGENSVNEHQAERDGRLEPGREAVPTGEQVFAQPPPGEGEVMQPTEPLTPEVSSKQIFSEVKDRLKEIGFSESQASNKAQLQQEFFRVLGTSEGKDPYQLYKRYGLSVSRNIGLTEDQATRLEQGTGDRAIFFAVAAHKGRYQITAAPGTNMAARMIGERMLIESLNASPQYEGGVAQDMIRSMERAAVGHGAKVIAMPVQGLSEKLIKSFEAQNYKQVQGSKGEFLLVKDLTQEIYNQSAADSDQARLARARAMGFDTSKVYYHGTFAEFDAFKPSHGGYVGPGIYVSENKIAANNYGDKVMSLYLKVAKPLDLQRTKAGDEAARVAAGALGVESEFKERQGQAFSPGNYRDLVDAFVDKNDPEGKWIGTEKDKAFHEALRQAGYDAIDYTHNGMHARIVFSPEQIRSVDAAFKEEGDNIFYQSGGVPIPEVLPQAEAFYSQLERTLEAKMPVQAPVKDVLGMIKEIKAEERKWSGIDLFLEGKDTVTKAELLELIRANQLQTRIKTVVKGGMTRARDLKAQELFGESFANLSDARKEEIIDLEGNGHLDIFEAKYSQYTTPGGENYREVLYTLPANTGLLRLPSEYTFKKIKKLFHVIDQENESIGSGATEQQAIKNSFTDERLEELSANYTHAHWDEENVFAFQRLKDFIDAEGKKVILIDEIQSDLFEELRGLEKELKRRLELSAEEQARYDLLKSFPFAKNWHEFPLKNLLREAAEKGYDRIAWTTGAQQADRYNLSKKVSKIVYEAEINKLYVIDINGKQVINQKATPIELPDIIGKDMAQKLLATKSDDGTQTLEGLDLKIGGEGKSVLYDTMIPSFLNKFGKQFGASVKQTRIPIGQRELTAQEESTKKALSDLGRLSFDDFRVNKEESDENRTIYDTGVSGQMLPRIIVSHYNNDHASLQTENQPSVGAPSLDQLKAKVFGEKVDRTQYETVHSLDITPSMRESVLTKGFTLFQDEDDKDGKRGQISFGPSRTQFEIMLGKKADLSTYLHESWHYFFEVLADVAKDPDASPRTKQILADLLEFLEVKRMEDVTTAHHEKLAEAGETYLSKGIAPSRRLRKAFRAFQAWLIDVYKRLRGANVPLSDEVIAAFDRMLATDAEIIEAKKTLMLDRGVNEALTQVMGGAEGLTPPDTQLPVDPKLMEAYQDLQIDLTVEAQERLHAKVFNDLNRKNQKFYKDKRKGVFKEVLGELKALREYRALDALTNNPPPDLPPGQGFKISTDSLKSLSATDMPRGVSSKDGIHVEIVAQMLGYLNGQALVDSLSGLEPLSVRAEAVTDERMKEYYPDELTAATLSIEAIKALHNDKAAELKRMEFEILTEKYLPELKELIRLGTRKLPTTAEVKARALKMIGSRKVRDIRPDLFLRAEIKARREAGIALARADIEKFLMAKTHELINHEAYRSAIDALEILDKRLKFFKRLSKPDEKIAKSREMDLVNTARAILAEFGIGPVSRSAESYLEPILLYDNQDTYENLKLQVQSATERKGPYRDVAFDDFVAMSDTIAALWDLAKTRKEFIIGEEKIDREVIINQLISRLVEITPVKDQLGKHGKPTPWEEFKIWLLGTKAALTRMTTWVSIMDADDPNGVYRKYTYNPVNQQTTVFRLNEFKYLQKYLALLKPLEPRLKELGSPIAAPELAYTFNNLEHLLGAVIHSGNMSNLSKLLRGNGWGLQDFEGVLDRSRWDQTIARLMREGVLTKVEYDFVQAVWYLNAQLLPAAQKTHKQLYGTYFGTIELTPIVTPWGTYPGGYMPAQANTLLSPDAQIRADKANLEKLGNSFSFPSTGRGFTKARVEAYSAPLVMDLRLVPLHINAALRFIHLQPVIRQTARIFNNREFRAHLNHFDAGVASDLLNPYLQRTASQQVVIPASSQAGKMADWAFSEIRARSSMQLMVLNVTNALQQTVGLMLAAVKVKPRNLRHAGWTYLRGPTKTVEMIAAKSPWMRSRLTESGIEIQRTIREILLNPSGLETVRLYAAKHGHFMGVGLQNIVDNITWLGAYNEAVEGGAPEAQAILMADDAVKTTQGSGLPEDVSAMETGTPFRLSFQMFYTYFNMYANLMGGETEKIIRHMGLRKGLGRGLYVYMLGLAMAAAVNEAIVGLMSGGGLDEDDDGQYMDDLILRYFFGAQLRTLTAFFPGGSVINAGFNMWNNKMYDDRISTSPAVSTLESTVRSPHSVYKAVVDNGSKKMAVRDTLTAIGFLTRLPLTPLAKPIGYSIDVMESKAKPTGPIDMARGLVTGKSGYKK